MAAKMGFGQFFAETWVGSNKPSFQPSDCMNASVDSSYLSGYNILITAIFPLCPISASAFSYTIAALIMGWTGRRALTTPARLLQHNSILTIIVIVVMIALL